MNTINYYRDFISMKMLGVIFSAILYGSLSTTLFAQNTVGLLSYQPDKTYEGYNLFFPHNQSTVFLTDNCGQLVHKWEDETIYRPGNMVYLLENGNLVKCKRFNNPTSDSIWAGGGGAIVEIRNWENELIWSWEQNNDTARLHHDVAPLPNGNILMLAWELISGEDAIQGGRDPELLPQNKIWPDYIYEVNPQTNEIVWEWHTWDHLIQDHDPTKDNFGNVAEHPELIDVNWDTHDGHPDWMHANAIDYNPVLDQIVLSVPYFHEIWVIDHSTTTEEAAGHTGGNSGMGGDILYRWGNPQTYRQGTEEDQQLFFSHDIHWISPNATRDDADFGKMGVFNNRVGENYSTANTFISPIDREGFTYNKEVSAYAPSDFERVIKHPVDSTQMHSSSVSSMQVLPNGNVLACAGRWGQVYEITPENEIAWSYKVPIKAGGFASQGDTLVINQNLTFRFKRYSSDYAAFIDRDVSPKGYLELEANENFCLQALPIDASSLSKDLNIYPNPVSNILQIETHEVFNKKFQVWDMNGREIFNGLHAGTTSTLNVEDWKAGLYLIKIDGFVSRKIWVK